MTRRYLIPILLSLALWPLRGAAAQEELVPRSSLVLVDENCVHSPAPLLVDGDVVVVWMGGIRARRGANLDSLGPVADLLTAPLRSISAIAGAGSFVVGFTNDFSPVQEVSYRRFHAGLEPAAPAVLLDSGQSQWWSAPALALEPGGGLTAVWTNTAQTVKIRRFSAADAPLGPVVEIHPGQGLVAFALGHSSLLLVRQELAAPGVSRLFARAYALDGTPLGAAFQLAEDDVWSEVALAVTEEGFMSLRTAGGDLHLQTLGADGRPLGSERPLGLDRWARFARIAVAGDNAWIAWATHSPLWEDPRLLSLVRVDLTSGESSVPERLERLGESFYAIPTHLQPDGDGVLVGWQVGVEPAILPTQCDPGLAVYARAFGPDRGTVDVPTLSSLGWVICTLLFAVAATGILLRRPS